MAVSFVNYAAAGVNFQPSGDGPVLTSVAGNLLVVVVRAEIGATTDRTASITDLAGNNYTLAKKALFQVSGATNIVWVWYAYNVPAYTNNRQTVTLNTTTNGCGILQAQFSGVRTASDPLVGAESVQGTTTAEVTTPAIVFSGGGALVVVGSVWTYNGTWTPGSGVTEHIDNAAGKMIMLGSKSASAGNNTATATVSSVTEPWGLVSVGFADDSVATGSLTIPRSRSKHLLIR